MNSLALTKATVCLVFIGVFLVTLGFIKHKDEYKKPKNWVISQSLNDSLTKQKELLAAIKGKELSTDDYARIATQSTQLAAKVTETSDGYELTTDAVGLVKASVALGSYKIEIDEIEKTDFTGVPSKININQGNLVLNIGLTRGSGKTRLIGELSSSGETAGSQNLVISLFSDKDSNGQKDLLEPNLSWAGVKIRLIKEMF